MNKRTVPPETMPRATGDLWVAYGCLAAAMAVTATGVWLVTAHQVLAAVLVLWLVPSLLLVAARARRADTKQKESKAVSEATELDKTRRYLTPVRATIISDDPDGVHLAVYSWLEIFKDWVTGPGICGESMQQGPLPEDTVVTCARCLEWQPKYERYLAPGYQPEDDDPDALRAKLERIRAEVRMLCDCCGDNRERMGRIRAELGLNTEGYFCEDGEGL